MINALIYGMVYLGSLLMVYNIYGFIRYARSIPARKDWGSERHLLNVPIVLLIMFLTGYLLVGFLGKPDLIVSGILFGGSIFVFIIYRLICRITRRIQEDVKLNARLMASDASNRAKNSFLSTMSHEMRTPMNAIIGLNTIALQDESLNPQTRERLEKIGISARHLLDMINDVLQMNDIESGHLSVKNEPFSMHEVLELVNLVTQSNCTDKGLEYRFNDVGDAAPAYIGDAFRLKQVLLSVLGNAVKFTPPPGTVEFTLERIPVSDARCRLRFTVRDTGVGMDREFLPMLFTAFSQEDASTTNRFGGSGLHLAIAKRILDLMGGEITAESEKGTGSTFVITVEVGVCEPSKEGAAEPVVSLNGRRVLIAEDIDLNADILADLLDMEGIASERAENGQVAVDMFSGHAPGYYDAILMDLRMPVMDGFDATRAIRGLPRPDAARIPIVALTANILPEDVAHSLAVGMNVHLAKPADIEEICRALNRLIAENMAN